MSDFFYFAELIYELVSRGPDASEFSPNCVDGTQPVQSLLADLTAKVGRSTEVKPRLQYMIVKPSLYAYVACYFRSLMSCTRWMWFLK